MAEEAELGYGTSDYDPLFPIETVVLDCADVFDHLVSPRRHQLFQVDLGGQLREAWVLNHTSPNLLSTSTSTWPGVSNFSCLTTGLLPL